MVWSARAPGEPMLHSGKRAKRSEADAMAASPRQPALTVAHAPPDLSSTDCAQRTDAETQRRFRELMLPHLDAAYNLARYLARDEDMAADVVQDAFVRALRGFATYREGNAKAWLLAIVRNVFLTGARARGSGRTVSLEAHVKSDGEPGDSERDIWDPAQDTPEMALVRSDESRLMQDLIGALPPPFRETLVLRELEELSYQEIAAATGAPIGTVMSRLARARGMLERAWRRHNSDREQSG